MWNTEADTCYYRRNWHLFGSLFIFENETLKVKKVGENHDFQWISMIFPMLFYKGILLSPTFKVSFSKMRVPIDLIPKNATLSWGGLYALQKSRATFVSEKKRKRSVQSQLFDPSPLIFAEPARFWRISARFLKNFACGALYGCFLCIKMYDFLLYNILNPKNFRLRRSVRVFLKAKCIIYPCRTY